MALLLLVFALLEPFAAFSCGYPHAGYARHFVVAGRIIGSRGRAHVLRAVVSNSSKLASTELVITDDQVADMSGVLSRVMLIPGMPDFVKLGIVKSGMEQVATAMNSDALSPELRSQVKGALGDGLLSKELASKIAKVIAPAIDIPLLNEEQEEALIMNLVSAMLVQREEENLIAYAMKGTYTASAKFAYTKGRDVLTLAAPFRSAESRKALVQKLNRDFDIPLLSEEQEARIIEACVNALGDLVMSKIPSGALEAAVTSGQEEEVEKFLMTLLADEIKVPFTSAAQRRDMAGQVVRGWLGTVDKEKLQAEELEAQRAAAEQAKIRADFMKGVEERSTAAMDFLTSEEQQKLRADLVKRAQTDSASAIDFLASAANALGSVVGGSGGGPKGRDGGNGRGGGNGHGNESSNPARKGLPGRKGFGLVVLLSLAVAAYLRYRRRARSKQDMWQQLLSHALTEHARRIH
eukprot:TRINITY_DN50488_c0_g1_i1.p1 TRINITY_DN50488_c0_g1~~TRINITY_DN50488_c0_g1_i1.p1  ORF type:complete len:465 (-),score=101.09 TRINITY_DN50488_c0_g1_i1:240-1634(-)